MRASLKWDEVRLVASEGGGGTPERPPRNRKNCCRNLVLSFRCIYLGKESKILEIFNKKCIKKSIFHRDFDQKYLNCLKIFQNFFLVFGPNAKTSGGRFLNFPCPMEIILQILMIFHFSTNFCRFSPKVSRIFIPFPIVLLQLSHFWAFCNCLNEII